MNHYKFTNYIKISFLLSAIILAGLFFYINKFITSELKKDLNQQFKSIAQSYQEAINSKPANIDMMNEISSLVDELELSIIIKTEYNNGDKSPACQKLSIKQNDNSSECTVEINNLIKKMEGSNEPFIINGGKGITISTYYGDTSIINKIQSTPEFFDSIT